MQALKSSDRQSTLEFIIWLHNTEAKKHNKPMIEIMWMKQLKRHSKVPFYAILRATDRQKEGTGDLKSVARVWWTQEEYPANLVISIQHHTRSFGAQAVLMHIDGHGRDPWQREIKCRQGISAQTGTAKNHLREGKFGSKNHFGEGQLQLRIERTH